MRFSEHELTAALHGAAKSVLAARRRSVPKGSTIDEVWAGMDRLQRFTILDALGGQVLPVLVALPDVDVAPGTRATYDDATVGEVVSAQLDGSGGRLKRAVLLKTRVALVQIALASVPPRLDPDALLHAESSGPDIPDSPAGLA